MRLFYSFLLVGISTTMSYAQDFEPCVVPENTSDTRVYEDLTGTCRHSTMHLGPPQVQGAEATVTFNNTQVHGPQHNETYDLTMGGLTATITFQWNPQGSSDSVEVVPPDGYVAVPTIAEVPEGTTQEFHIYKYQGM